MSAAAEGAARAAAAAATATAPEPDDPHRWLEEVLGERALAWVRERNAESAAELTTRPLFGELKAQLLEVLDDRLRIPAIQRIGEQVYNFWQDAAHPRGLWRRTTLDDYRAAEPAWVTVLDLDALARAEGENWVWKGSTCRPPTGGEGAWTRCLLHLSRGGADAVVLREFDLVERAFVPGGFALPEAKSDVAWLGPDELLVGSDFGPGSLTDSGYPRVIRRWRRGSPLVEAPLVFEAQRSDVSASVWVDATPGFERVGLSRAIDFYRSEDFLWVDATPGGGVDPAVQSAARLQRLDKPQDASLSLHAEWALLSLRSPLSVGATQHPAGSLLVTRADDLLAGQPDWQALFTPTETRSLDGWTWTRSQLLLTVLDNVAAQGEALSWQPSAPGSRNGTWQRRALPLPGPGTLTLRALHDPQRRDDPLAEHYLVGYTDFLTPDSLLLGQTGSDALALLKQRVRHFDAQGMRVEQRFATSRDGTRVPYFIVWPPAAAADGRHPTLLYGYGGFEVSMQPWYSAAFGKAWYQRGGVLVVANLRGGGEFGPAWHQAAVKAHKQRSYDDFIAVAEDLVHHGVTEPKRLGIMGGSNGGLLVGAAFTQRPELFAAVVCQVPLLDMRRYHRLLAGASWMAEYGDPDQAEDWAWIGRYSPYHQLRPGAGYPRVLFTTSTRDDRVHPAHARKMVARLRELGHPVLYYENTEGGHGGAADNAQRAHLMALEYSYLWAQLGGR
ncbi:MAG TPA: prolyl oligopeptidase family serine peptidase [Burkholderiaceae bacterium]|nr:prolyl oligopeptidase family serine peptidase [Burkholderiaceae bacterium]HMY99297.1 prolyl oligopeptidase family serine peptidase [Burkholderiaceae bacterium]HNB43186.1 prolyl oligopeptidase family serine peptidase [Burkholderiaceae bacterium]HNG81216.1 prolyl oligopeptidase family serine peptidase [Burkholderiaceae bacterium]